MTRRYFLNSRLTAELPATARLEHEEAHHLLNVMRGKVGDTVVLFDGVGGEYAAKIDAIEKRSVILSIHERLEINREPTVRLHLGVALPKGERQQWLCEKLVELGCSQLTPLITRRGVAEPRGAAVARLQRAVIEASKQCGRNQLMHIGEPAAVQDFLETKSPEATRLFLDATGEAVDHASDSTSDSVLAAVGPEGGWSESELATAKTHNWRIISLGARILRVETAAIAIAARFCID